MDPLADDYLSVQHLSEAAGVAAALQSLRCHPRMKRKSRCQKASQERHPVNKAGGKAKGKIRDKLNNLVLPDKATYARLRDFLTQFSPVAQSCLTLCDPMNCSTPGLPPCPSPTPGVHSNPCPWSRWCHPTISSSVVPFSSCPQTFPASGSFPMSQFLTTSLKPQLSSLRNWRLTAPWPGQPFKRYLVKHPWKWFQSTEYK